jgi:hypothetical protein
MIWDVHPESQILDPDLDFLPILDPGSRGQKDTGSLICNIDFNVKLSSA